ncbi:MAG TPA: tetratricopeptide repeat protein, partial [Abditibacteriaceae bacterium]|nr:tetratricopeptide repeat protein [Abditibacteriaceae bacterium]
GQAAAEAVETAIAFDTLAEKSGAGARAKWRARAAEEYRKALRLMPDFDSEDAHKLNALGYFLADRGTTPDDFNKAERLTRNSLALWDKQLAQLNKSDPRLPLLRFSREVGPHDSLAWALYRQGRYEEALHEQTAAIAAARAASAASKVSTGPLASELYFHLGEIYRALGRPQEARRHYQEALRLNPDDTARRRAVQGLPPQ